MDPLVSIKIITYNHEKFISDCIDGVLMQKVDFPYEIIIGEDCSTDRTREILFDYQTKNPDIIRVITSNENVGPLQNSQRVVKACRGKYMALCDGDDYWTDPNKLAKQIEFLEKNPDFGMVYSDICFVDENSQEIPPNPYFVDRVNKYRSDDIFWDLFKANFINTSTVVLHTEIYRSILPSTIEELEKKWYIHDYWIWLFVAKDYLVKYFEEKTAAYRTHSGNITNPNYGFFVNNKSGYVMYDIITHIDKTSVSKEKKNLINSKLISIIVNKQSSLKLKILAFGQLLKYFPSISYLSEKIKSRYLKINKQYE